MSHHKISLVHVLTGNVLDAAAALRPCNQIQPLLPLCHHHRTLFGRFFKRRQKDNKPLDPDSPEFKKKLEEGKKAREKEQVAQLNSGDLAPSSIFHDESQSQKGIPGEGKGASVEGGRAARVQNWRTIPATPRDPNPRTRIKWLRKMVLKDVRGRGRLTRTEKLLRTERKHVAKSPLIKTSIKKLGPLARQIAGKPLAEAMIQMRFSKKRAAGDVLKHLQYARSRAIVEKRMGLGTVASDADKGKEQSGEGQQSQAVVVEDKQGKKRTVSDKSAIYVDEAWVGRGAYEFGTDYRARGRAHKLYKPFTSKSGTGCTTGCRRETNDVH